MLLYGSANLEATAVSAALVAGLGAALAVEWWLVVRLANRRGGRFVLTATGLAAGGAGLALMLSGYATGGLIGVPLAAGLAAALAGSFLPGRSACLPGALAVGLVGLFGLVIGGVFFAELPRWSAAAVGTAPLFLWVPELVGRGRLGPRVSGAIGLVLASGVVAAVVALAVRAFVAAQAEQF